ncbi:MAG: KAP family NTPase [Bacteroidales bacterium]|jgi:nucleoside-triphosphatase THEP1|nr:KAP family NTPase [Bacteroidales bacterium]
MKIKHTEIEINTENPFANCKLDRKQYASILSDIVNTYADGFVLAINNEWGTGKTTFVKMWQQDLKNNGFKTIYFNAWENDFNKNPLVALMSELQMLTKENNKLFKSVIEKGAVLAKNVLPALLKSVVKTMTGIDSDIIENIAKGTTEIFEKEINEYTTKKKTVLEFKKDLEKFIKEISTDKPLVFIIDELDRCRPDYAVEVLEQVKHFFSVSGVVFVLSIDKNHLASSIKGYYGSESINTNEYLRRFIDLEYSIPKPFTRQFCNYLFDFYSFDDFYSNNDDSYYLLTMSVLLFDKSNATLRQQEKIFALTRLILSSFDSNKGTFSHLLFVLIYTKVFYSQLYEKIKNKVYSLQELCDFFENLVSLENNEYGKNLVYVEALLLHFYNNNKGHNREKLVERDSNGNTICLIKSKFKNVFEKDNYLKNCLNKVEEYTLNLNYFLDKIDLTQPINKI